MANKIQIRRGLKSELPSLSAGEPGYTTDTRELYVGTGSGNVNMGGSHWYTGTAMSGTSLNTGAYIYSECPEVKLDDMYLNTNNGNIYTCTTAGKGIAAEWTYKGCLKGLRGEKGATGDAGADGEDGVRSATVVIGLSTAGYTENEVDYICDGASDQTEIQAAIDALPENGGKIVLLEGTYNITGLINCHKNVVFEGMGAGTVLNFNGNSYIVQDLIQISFLRLKINFVSGNDDDSGYDFVVGSVTNDNSLLYRKVNMFDCIMIFTNNNFVKCASVFYGCGHVKIANSSIELINNAVAANSSYTSRINLLYDEARYGFDRKAHYAEISNCDILCRGKISGSYKSWACISKCGGTVISNCNITLESCGSISEDIDVVDGLYLTSLSNCRINHTGTTDVYIGASIFNGNRYLSSGGITYFANGAIIMGNEFANHDYDDIKVGLSENGVATIIGNRADYSCVFTSSTHNYTKKDYNV